MIATAVNNLRHELYRLMESNAPYDEIVQKSQELDTFVVIQQKAIYEAQKGGKPMGQSIAFMAVKGTSREVTNALKALSEKEFEGMKASAISAAAAKQRRG